MDKGACFVWAGHQAIATANADVLVHQHDAIGALERSACRAHIDARWFGTMLAHHWQKLGFTGAQFLDFEFANPLGIGWQGFTRESIFSIAGCYTVSAATGAFITVD